MNSSMYEQQELFNVFMNLTQAFLPVFCGNKYYKYNLMPLKNNLCPGTYIQFLRKPADLRLPRMGFVEIS